jgi:hypothetical protein
MIRPLFIFIIRPHLPSSSPVIATASKEKQEARKEAVLHCKSNLHNYHTCPAYCGINFISLFITFGITN